MKAIIQTNKNYTILSQQGFADILSNNITSEKLLQNSKKIIAGDIVSKFSAKIISTKPTYLTVQIGIDEHITLQPEFLQYINHSCDPNVFFDTTNYELIALKNIEVGEEFTFFYPSSEWNMTQGFVCTCHSKNCLHNIRGAAHVSKEILANYKLTNFIQSMLDIQ
jgi:hypothetical protein